MSKKGKPKELKFLLAVTEKLNNKNDLGNLIESGSSDFELGEPGQSPEDVAERLAGNEPESIFVYEMSIKRVESFGVESEPVLIPCGVDYE